MKVTKNVEKRTLVIEFDNGLVYKCKVKSGKKGIASETARFKEQKLPSLGIKNLFDFANNFLKVEFEVTKEQVLEVRKNFVNELFLPNDKESIAARIKELESELSMYKNKLKNLK